MKNRILLFTFGISLIFYGIDQAVGEENSLVDKILESLCKLQSSMSIDQPDEKLSERQILEEAQVLGEPFSGDAEFTQGTLTRVSYYSSSDNIPKEKAQQIYLNIIKEIQIRAGDTGKAVNEPNYDDGPECVRKTTFWGFDNEILLVSMTMYPGKNARPSITVERIEKENLISGDLGSFWQKTLMRIDNNQLREEIPKQSTDLEYNLMGNSQNMKGKNDSKTSRDTQQKDQKDPSRNRKPHSNWQFIMLITFACFILGIVIYSKIVMLRNQSK
jgi:hypothetical protein